MATATQSTMSKQTFHLSKEFLAVTEKQRVWVDAFVDSRDAAQATRIAYGAKTDSAYRAMLTRKIETSPRILAALDLYYARSPREKFLRDLQLDIEHSKGIAKIEGCRLYAKVTGLVDDSPTAEAEHLVCKIGDVVLVDGVKHRVTAVDENGRPTEGDPL
jgi:hypothetical protein